MGGEATFAEAIINEEIAQIPDLPTLARERRGWTEHIELASDRSDRSRLRPPLPAISHDWPITFNSAVS